MRSAGTPGDERITQRLGGDVQQRGATPQGRRAPGGVRRIGPPPLAYCRMGLPAQRLEREHVRLVLAGPQREDRQQRSPNPQPHHSPPSLRRPGAPWHAGATGMAQRSGQTDLAHRTIRGHGKAIRGRSDARKKTLMIRRSRLWRLLTVGAVALATLSGLAATTSAAIADGLHAFPSTDSAGPLNLAANTAASQEGAVKGDDAVMSVYHFDSIKNQAASPNAACAITEYGYAGEYICGFNVLPVAHDGLTEYFVVGTDYAIWHIWPGSGGWHSLGGKARKATPNGVYLEGIVSTDSWGIYTYGTDNHTWCNNWGIPWSGWYSCTIVTVGG